MTDPWPLWLRAWDALCDGCFAQKEHGRVTDNRASDRVVFVTCDGRVERERVGVVAVRLGDDRVVHCPLPGDADFVVPKRGRYVSVYTSPSVPHRARLHKDCGVLRAAVAVLFWMAVAVGFVMMTLCDW